VWRPAEAAALAPAPRLGTQERFAALETQVFGKPSVAPRTPPAPKLDTEATLKAKSDRLKRTEDRRAAALKAREERLKNSKPVNTLPKPSK